MRACLLKQLRGLFLVCLLSHTVLAQDGEHAPDLLAEDESRPVAKWMDDQFLMPVMKPYDDTKRWLHEEINLDVAAQYVAIYQRATGGRRPREHTIENLTVFGQWHLIDNAESGSGAVGFYFEHRNNITKAKGGEFSREVGSTFDTHDYASNNRTALRRLWWRQRFARDQITLTVGKIHHGSYYNGNAFAGSTSTQFFSQPFATNPARQFDADGLGANLKITPKESFYVSMGFGDANSKNTTSGFNSIDDAEFFKAAELGLTPTIDGWGKGTYRFTFWHTDETEGHDDGLGFALSFDQELGQSLGAFLRYGYSDPDLNRIEHLLAVGLVIRNPVGIEGDLLGVGFSWDRGDSAVGDEYALEAFYRAQMSTHVQLSPSILMVFDPARSSKSNPVAVFGLRVRTLF